MAGHDVDRFNEWAQTYEGHRLQRIILEPVQETALQLAVQETPRAGAILDVGCGTGRLLRSAVKRFPGARLVGLDAAIEMVKQAQALVPNDVAIRFQQGIAEELPFDAASFDVVFSTLTFHHWHDQTRGIAEVRRVLTPNGRWLLADFFPTGMMRYVTRLLRLKHFQERGRLEAMLAKSGLAVVAQRRVSRLGAQLPVLAIGARP